MATRWLIAVVATIFIHVVALVLLNSYSFQSGSFKSSAHQSRDSLTVLISPLPKQELPEAIAQVKMPSVDDVVAKSNSTKEQPSSSVSKFTHGYFSARELDVLPVARRDVHIFPEGVKELEESGGKVVIDLWIDESGHVVKSELLESELPPGLGDVAVDVFMKAEFMPGMKNGSPVKSRVKVVIVYSSR